MSVAPYELRIPARRLAIAAPVVLLAVLLALPWPGEPARVAVRSVVAPRAVADVATVRAQAAAAALAVFDSHARSLATIDRARALRLSIAPQEADRIHARAALDLATIRQSALALIATLSELTADDLEALARTPSARAETVPLVLAPSLSTVTREADRMLQQASDRAVRELTAPPR